MFAVITARSHCYIRSASIFGFVVVRLT